VRLDILYWLGAVGGAVSAGNIFVFVALFLWDYFIEKRQLPVMEKNAMFGSSSKAV